MNFEEYQKRAGDTALYPDVGNNIVYPTLGLAGEAGEIANKVKKIYRDEGGLLTEEKKEDLKKEIGDVIWYLARLSSELGLSLNDIAELNIQRLKDRKDRGVVHGNGDNR